jgi:hypothetical protein
VVCNRALKFFQWRNMWARLQTTPSTEDLAPSTEDLHPAPRKNKPTKYLTFPSQHRKKTNQIPNFPYPAPRENKPTTQSSLQSTSQNFQSQKEQ